MGAVQLGFGAVSTALVSMFNNGTAMPMSVVMCTCAIISFTVLLIGRKMIRQKQVSFEFLNED
jgi:DHA1 family bicyclomycin/chloramphenicol resistance-like MFS transporter